MKLTKQASNNKLKQKCAMQIRCNNVRIRICQLTSSTENRPWKFDSRSAGKRIFYLEWNPGGYITVFTKASHYLEPIRSSPYHVLCQTHINIILPPTPRFSKKLSQEVVATK